MPSRASRSMCGVRRVGWPNAPTSSHARSSAMMSTMFGRDAGAAAPAEKARTKEKQQSKDRMACGEDPLVGPNESTADFAGTQTEQEDRKGREEAWLFFPLFPSFLF